MGMGGAAHLLHDFGLDHHDLSNLFPGAGVQVLDDLRALVEEVSLALVQEVEDLEGFFLLELDIEVLLNGGFGLLGL